MQNKPLLIISIVVLVLAVAFNTFLYVVPETEQVVITQFGEYKRVEKDAGLKVKLPFVEKVNYFEKRLLEWDGKPNQLPTLEKRYINIDTFARWRIVDPLLYMKTLLGSEDAAQSRLDDIINSEVRNLISSNYLIETVRDSQRDMTIKVDVEGERDEELQSVDKGRSEIERLILDNAKEATEKFGIELVQVKIKRLNYTEQVQKKVYERMVEERLRVAAEYRSEGEGEMLRISGESENEQKRIMSEAYKESEQIRGESDAKAINIYAKAYSLDPEFYSFTKTMESYKQNLEGGILMLSTESEYTKYIKNLDIDTRE
jgi:modulator of FtsH protease HflC